MAGGLTIGQATIYNAVVYPGDNTFPASGRVYFDVILDNLAVIIASQTNALRNGNIEITASGNSTVFDGQHIQYLESVLNGLSLAAQVPIGLLAAGTLEGILDGTDTISDILGLLNLTTT